MLARAAERRRHTQLTHPERRRGAHPVTQRRINRIHRFDAVLATAVAWGAIALFALIAVVAVGA